jgi:hypothetical protein
MLGHAFVAFGLPKANCNSKFVLSNIAVYVGGSTHGGRDEKMFVC